MKTPEEIKKGLATCIGKCDGTKECPYQDCNNACEDRLHRDLLHYIHDLEAAHRTGYCENADYDCVELGKARKRIAELEAQVAKDMNVPRWVSVDDKLPGETDDRRDFLVRYKYSRNDDKTRYAVLNWSADEKRFLFYGLRTSCVTHWMPLPRPLKED